MIKSPSIKKLGVFIYQKVSNFREDSLFLGGDYEFTYEKYDDFLLLNIISLDYFLKTDAQNISYIILEYDGIASDKIFDFNLILSRGIQIKLFIKKLDIWNLIKQ